jgi:hypothetical protein
MMNDDKQQKKRIIIAASVMVVLLLGITIVPLFFSNESTNQDDPDSSTVTPATPEAKVNIANIPEQNKGENQDIEWLDRIKVELLRLAKTNSGNYDLVATDITDATIRQGSYVQNYDNTTDTTSVDFIVDIPSLKQSYRAHYEWTNIVTQEGGLVDPERGMKMLQCLPTSQLIYSDFKCKDQMVEQYGWPYYDEILEHLPYHGASTYYIYPARTTSNKPLLVIHLNTTESNSTLSIRYKNEALSQIRAWGFDPSNYDVNFEYDT